MAMHTAARTRRARAFIPVTLFYLRERVLGRLERRVRLQRELVAALGFRAIAAVGGDDAEVELRWRDLVSELDQLLELRGGEVDAPELHRGRSQPRSRAHVRRVQFDRARERVERLCRPLRAP